MRGSGVNRGMVMSPPLLERVRLRMAADSASPDLGALTLRESELVVDSGALAELSGQLSAELRGAGPLEELLALPGVTDVLVNAPEEIWFDRGSGFERSTVQFASDSAVRVLAVRLAAQAGRRLDDAAPFVDASLPDGTRLHAILPPLVDHPTLSLRVLSRRRLTMEDLVRAGLLSAAMAEVLQALVSARMTLLISGGTGAGKTTLLAALLSTVAPTERIVTIEDAPELAVDHPHVVGLHARSANIEQAGAVGLRELVRQSLRMRADRLVVGEFRGAEIVELLAALNTGHSGGAATVHANSMGDVPARLVALAALGGMSAEVLGAQARSGLDVVIQLGRDRGGVRQLTEIGLWSRSDRAAGPDTVWSRAGGRGPAAAELAGRIYVAGIAVPELLTDARTGPDRADEEGGCRR
ncbi:MAG: pilus assembly protein CpaF [Pseudonocardiales bacterium]|nr:pilus assembly protein CpaF [Pseudonocardiales bacterium]